jgi:hypothetical protein
MSMRALAWAPLVFATAFLLAGMLAGDAVPTVLRTENEAGKVLAVAGCIFAARSFDPGDYLRRAWLFSGGCMLLLLVRDVTIVPPIERVMVGNRLELTRGVLVVVANASSVAGAALLARAWSVSGLSTAGRRAWLVVAGVAVSLAATGWPLALDLRRIFHGDIDAIPFLGSDLGDMVCFALVAPVLDTALALRGGALLWPWALISASGFCWILYDAAWGMSSALHLDALPHARLVLDSLRGLACAFIASAGVAQSRAVRGA